MKKTEQNATTSDHLSNSLKIQKQPEESQQNSTQPGSVLTRVTALILIVLLFTVAYYLLIVNQEHKPTLQQSPPQPELFITIPQD